jgi:hypothetical protein
MSEGDSNFFTRVKNTINSIIWDLPFDNYHKYYKTGIIQKMSKDEKIDFFFERHKEFNKKDNIKKLIVLRPNILDDEDKILFLENKEKYNKIRGFYFIILCLNNIFSCYLILQRKSYVLKYVAISNLGLLSIFPFLNYKSQLVNEHLTNKYRNIISEEETYDVFKQSSNID